MAVLQDVSKIGAHSNQEARPCDTNSTRPTVAPDSQLPPTGRKRKHRTLSAGQQDSQQLRQRLPKKRRRISKPNCDRAQRSFWDSLSRLWLASDALRELDRRNALLEKCPPDQVKEISRQILPTNIQQFARHGGPDLSDLRQYSYSCAPSTLSYSMPSRSKGESSREKGSAGKKKKLRSSAYSPNFGQFLADSGISLVNRSHRAENHREWNEVLIQPRPSLSPSRMSDGHYERFVEAADDAETESEVMSHVFPKIVGKSRHPSRQDVQLGNLDPIAKSVVIPQPDYYEGDLPRRGNRQLRKQLDKSIVPSKHSHYPFLPNFFAEVKSSDGSLAVAQRQACHYGAVGARAMHRVENLGRRGEVFDNKARTASVICHGIGDLKFFNHHLSQPMGPGTPSETHMTPLRSFSLADGPDAFRQGVGAFRNASDFASQHRKDAIEGAHRRNKIITPEPPTISPRSTRRPLSCQTPVTDSSDSASGSSSEEEDSDDSNYRRSSRARPRGKILTPRVVTATPKRLASRDPSPPRRELRSRRGARRS